MASGAKICAIDKQVIHRICSGQVILDLATAVKELVENALDAGASNVEVRLKDYGAETVEVADNGTGIAPRDYHSLTLKYHTSKLQAFADLQELNSFGFRGEALSSLCALADVHVVTRQAEQSAGTKLEFNNAGNLKGTTAAARSIGTTVCVKHIFKPLPVRFKEFKRNVKKEYAKMVMLLQAYALISTGVRIICTNQAGNGPRSTVVSTQATESVRDNIVTVFGARTAEGLEALEASAGGGLQFTGFVSKGTAGMSRATGDRQFLFLNGRPVDLPKAVKIINETFRSLASPALAHHKPMFVINILAPTHSYDVNVTPDKRKVFIQDESRLLNTLQEALNTVWEPTRSRYEVNGSQPPSKHAGRPAAQAGSEEEEEAESSDDEDVGQPASRGEETPKPSSQIRSSGKSSMFAALARTSGQSHRSSLLGDPRRSSGGTPLLTSFGRENRTPHQPLISRFTVPSSGVSSGSHSKQVASVATPESPQSLGDQDVPEEAAPAPATLAARELQHASRDKEPGDATGIMSEASDEPVHVDADGNEDQDLDMIASGRQASGRTESPEAGEEALDLPKGGRVPASYTAELQQEALEPQGAHHAGRNTTFTDAYGEASPAKRRRVDPDASDLQDLTDSNRESEAGDEEVECTEQLESEAMTKDKSRPTNLQVAVNLEKLEERWRKRRKPTHPNSTPDGSELSHFQAASLQGKDLTSELQPASSENLSAAASELERVFQKSQFRELQILGQFNLGFILARRGHDLFIIDQHASDEKFNFERLTKTTQLNRQPLLQPQLLDLTPSETIIIRDNLEVFSRNGFHICDQDGTLVLKGVPYSHNISFGVSDVQELAQLLSEGNSIAGGQKPIMTQGSVNVSDKMPRPSRVRSMLAMRACRSSIMIGKTLDMRTMRRILDHLADLDSPWNCPHGRPTMRHLAVLPD